MISVSGYDISECIYNSANTSIYRAIRLKDQQAVILKKLNLDYPNASNGARFQHSFELLKRLQSRYVITAHELLSIPNALVMVLEDFKGHSLKFWLNQQSFSLSQQLSLSIQLSEAVAEIHAANIIHKDLNSNNIVYNPATGVLKLIDFDLATLLPREAPSLKTPERLEGTLAYMSPEQTGRMNIPLDYRTDLYSLGVTLFELYTGQLPFNSADPLELIHSHIAKQPPSPTQLATQLPPVISNIVLKLLAKSPDNRYQTARGLKNDWLQCQRAWQKSSKISDFHLAQGDISDKFQLPNKLYERQWAINSLLKAINRSQQQAHSELVLITGCEGIGKTALVQTVFTQNNNLNKAYFISGRFDSFHSHSPYYGLVMAMKELVQQLLTENEAQLKQITQQLLAVLGSNVSVMLAIVPELSVLLGTHPPPASLSGEAALNRFQWAWIKTIQVLAQAEHPLILFLDDLQWADSASLSLLEALLNQVTHLLVIVAYREIEIDANHPLIQTSRTLKNAEVAVSTVSLQPLSSNNIRQYIADLLHCDAYEVIELAELVLTKTHGNPFFIGEFLKTLHAEKLIVFNEEKQAWQWDIEQIYAHQITDNVVELLSHEIQKLSPAAQQCLQLAACIGGQFELTMLAQLAEQSPRKLTVLLKEAIEHQLILPLEHSVHGQHADIEAETAEDYVFTSEYQFVHERIQQAAYHLLDLTQQQAIHDRVGQYWLAQATLPYSADTLFAIVNQLNAGQLQHKTRAQQEQLAQLNLQAGQYALESVAYDAALRYLTTGLLILGEQAWQQCYALTLQLTVLSAEIQCLKGDFVKTEALTESILQHSYPILDKIKAYEIRIQAYKAQNNPQQAVKLGLFALSKLGIRFAKRPKHFSRIFSIALTRLALMGRPIDELAYLPTMLEAEKQAAMRLLLSISPPVYAVKPNLLPLITCKRVRLSIAYGNAAESIPAYASYGYLLCEQGHIDEGYHFAQLALKLLAQQQHPILKARVFQIVYGVIAHYKQSLHDTLPPLQEAYQSGLETGNLEYAMFSAATWVMHAFFAGKELPNLEQDIRLYTVMQQQLKQYTHLHSNQLYLQTVINLLNPIEDTLLSAVPISLEGEFYQETELLAQHQQAGARGLMFQVYLQKLILCCVFQAEQQAITNAQQAEQHIDAVIGSLLIPTFYFYSSLAHLAIATTLEPAQRVILLQKVTEYQQKLLPYSERAPMNYLHKYQLVAAELSYLQGHYATAREYYDQAIQNALNHEFIHEAALAQELAGRFYLARQLPRLAQLYLNDAFQQYQRWGAQTKVNQMEVRYARYLKRAALVNHLHHSLELSSFNSSVDLELASVLKAAQAFASEIVLDRLLTKVMAITLENAGAQRGFLLLNRNDHWCIEAESDLENNAVKILPALPLEDYPHLSVGIVYYVARTRESLVLADATSNPRFANDQYIVQSAPKSVLCAPLLNQGKLTSILYLENNLATGVFTSDRLTLMNLLSNQMAIAIDNARLYAELEEKVYERTSALEAKNKELIYLNQEKNEFLSIVAHDLKNPLSGIQGLAEAIELEYDALDKLEIIEMLSLIQNSSQQMFELINNLLDVNLIESGNIKVNRKTFDLLPLLRHLLLQYRVRAEVKKITFILVADEKTYYPVYADEKVVYQILENLLSNALKYSPNYTSVTISLKFKSDCLLCSIQDQGQGLTDEDKRKLFGKYNRLSAQPTGEEHSTGLGLFIVKKLVESLNGRVWCDSELGEGACFTVALPLVSEQKVINLN